MKTTNYLRKFVFRPLNGISPRISSPMNNEYLYDNGLFCQWTLSPRQSIGTLKLTIDPVFMEAATISGNCLDFLSVIRGDLTSGTLLSK